MEPLGSRPYMPDQGMNTILSVSGITYTPHTRTHTHTHTHIHTHAHTFLTYYASVSYVLGGDRKSFAYQKF